MRRKMVEFQMYGTGRTFFVAAKDVAGRRRAAEYAAETGIEVWLKNFILLGTPEEWDSIAQERCRAMARGAAVRSPRP